LRCLIGRKFSDPGFQDDIQKLPYVVVEKDGEPHIRVQINGTDTYFTPDSISAMVLDRLKNMAEAFLNHTVNFAVITVPPHFSERQREATDIAAGMAGLKALRIISETTAAGMAYGIDVPRREECNQCHFVIYSLGAKESNLALESVNHGVFDTLAVASDNNISGDGFDNALFNYAIAHFNSENNIDITQDFEAMERLKIEVKKAEEVLLTESQAKIEIPDHALFMRFPLIITWTQLQEIRRKLIIQALDMVKNLLYDANVEKTQVHGILFTGMPSHIAKVQQPLESYLDIQHHLAPSLTRSEHAVVHGAALQGHIQSFSYQEDGCRMFYTTRLSLGIETSGSTFTNLIPRNSIFPIRRMQLFTTTRDNQEKVEIRVLEGERAVAGRNKLLGTIELPELPLKPGGELEIEVLFQIDSDEIMTVMAREEESGKEASLIIPVSMNRYTQEEVNVIVGEAEYHYEEDKLLLQEYHINVQDSREANRFGVIAK